VVSLAYSHQLAPSTFDDQSDFVVVLVQFKDYFPGEVPPWQPQIVTVTLPSFVRIGGVYKIVIHDQTYSYTALTGDTNTVIAAALAALINDANIYWYGICTSGIDGITFTGEEDSGWETPFGTISGSVADSTTDVMTHYPGWKRGAWHPFGIVYRDEMQRTPGVSYNPNMKIYIKSPAEQKAAGAFYTRSSEAITTPGYSTRIDFTISNLPPSWAKTYQFCYFKSNILQYQQYWINKIEYKSVTGEKPPVMVDVNSLVLLDQAESSKSLVPAYEYKDGDRIRFIANRTGSYETLSYTLLSSYVDMAIIGIDETTGFVMVNNFDFATYSFAFGTIVEIYHPEYDVFTKEDGTALTDYNEQVGSHYFEVGPVFPISGGYHLVTGCTGGTNQDATHNAIGYLEKGDSYTRTRLLHGIAFTVECDSLSDFYESSVMHRGRIMIYNPNAAEITYENGLWHGGLNESPHDDLNEIFRFDYDGYSLEIPLKYGPIYRIRCIGDILKVIQRNKISSVYIGRDAASTVEGADIIRTTNRVLGSIRPSVDDYGTIFPESTLVDGTNIYLMDIYAKTFIVSTSGGNYDCGALGLNRKFTEMCNAILEEDLTKIKFFTCKDPYGYIYLSMVNSNTESDRYRSLTFCFDANQKKWKSFLVMEPTYLSGWYKMLSFINGTLYVHNHESGTPGIIYGSIVEQVIKTASSVEPKQHKVYLGIGLKTNLNSRFWRTYDITSALASGTITVSDTPVADETIQVGITIYTFKAARANDFEITISSNTTTQAENIVYAIIHDQGNVNAVNVANVVTVTAIPYGTDGNAIALAESATGIAVSGATLSGGTDTADALVLKGMWSCEYNGDVMVPSSQVNPSGMKSRIRAARFERVQGDLVADVPRDILDPTYLTVQERVVNGRKLQGDNLIVTIRNKAVVPVTLECLTIIYNK
jgi:hypothetical protein